MRRGGACVKLGASQPPSALAARSSSAPADVFVFREEEHEVPCEIDVLRERVVVRLEFLPFRDGTDADGRVGQGQGQERGGERNPVAAKVRQGVLSFGRGRAEGIEDSQFPSWQKVVHEVSSCRQVGFFSQ
jgi:hypothetical protein